MTSHVERLKPQSIEEFLNTVLPTQTSNALQNGASSLAALREERDAAVRNADYEAAARLRDQIESGRLPPAGRAKNLLRDLVAYSAAEKQGFDVAENIQRIEAELSGLIDDPGAISKGIRSSLAAKNLSA